MGVFALAGGFLAVAICIFVIAAVIRKRIQKFSREVFGKSDILDALADLEQQTNQTPRSLSGCDRLLLPQIRKDFPDFDEHLMKTYARDLLRKRFGDKDAFTIHNIVIARYLPSALSKTIILQAALSYAENGKLQQKRYLLHYTFSSDSGEDTIAANCPNCGGALGYGQRECPFCGSHIANIMGNTWKFTEIIED